MTLNQFLRIGVRRWYILLLCAVFTFVGVFYATRPAPVFWTRVNVVLLAPTTLDNPNALRETTESLISFAALVDREFNGHEMSPRFSTLQATLYGAGERTGSNVALLNTGGQWNDEFTRPEISVEVVDKSEKEVRAVLAGITARLDEIVTEQQVTAGVAGSDRITTLTSPQRAVVSIAQGNRMRAAVSVSLLGVAGGILITGLLDRWLLLRRPRPLEEQAAFEPALNR